MTFFIFYLVVVFLALLLLFLIGLVPILCLGVGIRRFRKSRTRGSAALLAMGAILFLAYPLATYAAITWVGPGQSGVLTYGYSPEGMEYCVVQTYKHILEPYKVSFYIRDADGIWHWNYLEHEDVAWRAAHVEFEGDRILVFRNGKQLREIPTPTEGVDIDSLPTGYRHQYCPAEFTLKDVVQAHHRRYR